MWSIPQDPWTGPATPGDADAIFNAQETTRSALIAEAGTRRTALIGALMALYGPEKARRLADEPTPF